METTIKGLGFGVLIGIMENKMETTIMGYMGIIGHILGFRVWGLGFGVWGLGSRVWGLGFRH